MSTPPTDAARYLAQAPKLRLQCRKCGCRKLVPWQQLDRVLVCNTCHVWYRVEPGGLVEVQPPQEERIRVAVRSMSSDWSEHRAVIRDNPSIRVRLRDAFFGFLLTGKTRWYVLAATIVVVAIGLFRPESESDAAKTETVTVFPKSLDERALMLTQALVRRDMPVLFALTDPGKHKVLRLWLGHSTSLPTESTDRAVIDKIKVQTQRDAHEPEQARVQVQGPREILPSTGLEECWSEMAGKWYFQPPRMRVGAKGEWKAGR